MKISKIIVSILFCILTCSSIVIIQQVKASSITSLDITTSPIDALFHFTVADSSAKIYIRFDDDTTPTDGYQTYTDPDDIISGTYGGGGTERWMIIRGLTEKTQYSYAIYYNSVIDATGYFNTTARYTNETGWGDEFFDSYLTDSSSNITLYQSVGAKYSGNPISDSSELSISGTGLVFNNGKYHVWANSYEEVGVPNNAKIMYKNSTTGLDFHGSWTQVSGSLTGKPAYFVMDKKNNRYVGYTMGTPSPYSWRIFNFVQGYEDDFASSEQIAIINPIGTQFENQGLSYTNNLSVIDLVVGSMHKDGIYAQRYTCMGYIIPDGTNYNKWIFPSAHKQHTDIPPSFNPGIVNDADIPGSDAGYGMIFFERNGIFFGLMFVLENNDYTNGRMYDYLVYSRDMYNWHVFSSTPIIPNGAYGVDFDGGMVHLTADGFKTIGDIDRIFYTGKFGKHGEATSTRLGRLGVIDFRKEGLTYAKSTNPLGTLTTIDIPRHFAKNLTINGAFSLSNKLYVSILDSDTDLPYVGFDTSDCTAITSDSTAIQPQWGTYTIEDIPAGQFKIKFTFSGIDGKLYSYHLDGNSSLIDSDYIGINSIAGKNNNSLFNDTTPIISWTNVPNDYYYQLQIDDDADFSSPLVDISLISATAYPVEFVLNGSNVEFTLPNTLQSYGVAHGWLYWRVRARIEYFTS